MHDLAAECREAKQILLAEGVDLSDIPSWITHTTGWSK